LFWSGREASAPLETPRPALVTFCRDESRPENLSQNLTITAICK
jgi:hypothetical protein